MSLGVKVYAVVVRKDRCAGRDEVVFVDVVFGGCVGEAARGDGTETLSFFDYGADVGEGGFVRELRETIRADDRVEFFLGCCDDARECNCC